MLLFLLASFQLFAFGIYSYLLAFIYLLTVSLVVGFLALGSIFLLNNKVLKSLFIVYFIFTTIFLIYTLITSQIGNIIVNYVVAGSIPLPIIISSSLMTFVSSIIIIVIAALSYKRKKDKRMLSIIAGILVVSFAGTMYIASFPSLLYYSEFIGILLLWLGFW